MKRGAILAWAWLGLCLAAGPGLAGGLQTRFVKALIEGLPVGSTARAQLATGEGYSVENSGDTPLDVGFRIIRPTAGDLQPSVYEPIPDAGWCSLSTNRVTVPPRGKAEVQLALSVPRAAAFANRKYEVWIRADTLGGNVGVALVSRIRIHTVPARDPPAMTATDTPATSSGVNAPSR